MSDDDYWSRVKTELSVGAPPSNSLVDWTAHRLKAAEYFYRAYNPSAPNEGFLALAWQELGAVLRLEPDNTTAIRYRNQILANQNILGLAGDLDVTPDFERYIAAFTSWGSIAFGNFQAGIVDMLAAKDRQDMVDGLALHIKEIDSSIASADDEQKITEIAVRIAQDEKSSADARVSDIKSQIEAARTAMNDHHMSFGEIVATVGEVAGAVVAVIAAVPTGGASLAALVPDIMLLTETTVKIVGELDNQAAIERLFKPDNVDVEKVKKAYGKASKDVANIMAAEKAVVNLVGVINRLSATEDADNAKYVALLRQGVEAAHGQMLAGLHALQADLTQQALQAKADRAREEKAKAEALLKAEQADQQVLNDAALTLIHNAQLGRDTLLRLGFLAERSVEIYTRKDEVAALFFDSGYVKPDVERDFTEGFDPGGIVLTTEYQKAWSKFLSPIKLEDDYVQYFTGEGNQLDIDSRRLSFKGVDAVEQLRTTHSFDFALDLKHLPPDHAEAKIQAVAVALVGASAPSGVISCEVTHGARYTQKLLDGSEDVLLLRSRSATVASSVKPLELAGVSFTLSSAPLTAPRELAFWGRGVAGQWRISVHQSEFDLHGADLTGLSEIQVWVAYQFKNAHA